LNVSAGHQSPRSQAASVQQGKLIQRGDASSVEEHATIYDDRVYVRAARVIDQRALWPVDGHTPSVVQVDECDIRLGTGGDAAYIIAHKQARSVYRGHAQHLHRQKRIGIPGFDLAQQGRHL
jgi:hypothetical protein